MHINTIRVEDVEEGQVLTMDATLYGHSNTETVVVVHTMHRPSLFHHKQVAQLRVCTFSGEEFLTHAFLFGTEMTLAPKKSPGKVPPIADTFTLCRITRRNFPTIVNSLWILPRPAEQWIVPYAYMEAYRSESGADWLHRKNKRSSLAWAGGAHAPVHFSTNKPPPGNWKFPSSAPRSCWIVADMSNGHCYDANGGQVWVFAFSSRAHARRYLELSRYNPNSNVIFSEPFKMWLQPE